MLSETVSLTIPFNLIVIGFISVACYFSYKKGMRRGIEKTVDWMEKNGHIDFKSE
jgi:hypothetical protein